MSRTSANEAVCCSMANWNGTARHGRPGGQIQQLRAHSALAGTVLIGQLKHDVGFTDHVIGIIQCQAGQLDRTCADDVYVLHIEIVLIIHVQVPVQIGKHSPREFRVGKPNRWGRDRRVVDKITAQDQTQAAQQRDRRYAEDQPDPRLLHECPVAQVKRIGGCPAIEKVLDPLPNWRQPSGLFGCRLSERRSPGRSQPEVGNGLEKSLDALNHSGAMA
jgi:hypothetical protein